MEGRTWFAPFQFPQGSRPSQRVYGRVLSFTWPKNRLLGQMTQKTCCGLSTQGRQLNADLKTDA